MINSENDSFIQNVFWVQNRHFFTSIKNHIYLIYQELLGCIHSYLLTSSSNNNNTVIINNPYTGDKKFTQYLPKEITPPGKSKLMCISYISNAHN